MKDVWDFIKKKLIKTQKNQKKQIDKKRATSSDYKVDEKVWLSTRNIQTNQSFKKLDHKMIESFVIKRSYSKLSARVVSVNEDTRHVSHFLIAISIWEFTI